MCPVENAGKQGMWSQLKIIARMIRYLIMQPITISIHKLQSIINVAIKSIVRQLREHFFGTLYRDFELHQQMIKTLADAHIRTRMILNIPRNQAINVLFVCHTPTLWSMFDTVYTAMLRDSEFHPIVVALPYTHGTLPRGQYTDEGMFECLKGKGVNVICGYDRRTQEWVNPLTLDPDYVFFQTPYPLFESFWTIANMSMFTKVCYIPYATCLFCGEVESLVHPDYFFKYTYLIFLENRFTRQSFENRFIEHKWYDANKVFLTGHPKIDRIVDNNVVSGKVWRLGIRNDVKRVLWTPRWRTNEGTCHFFDYKDFFSDFCSKYKNVDFVFRPHPLCFQNFLKTGELLVKDLNQLRSTYGNASNMTIDETGEYLDTFSTSDVLISDVSSMLLEYFVTGKPIIYTHRVDVFNNLGKNLSKGFYWARDLPELAKTLKMILEGNDPLKEKRQELIRSLLFIPEGGAGFKIKEAIKDDFTREQRRIFSTGRGVSESNR